MNQTNDVRHKALDIIEEFQKRARQLNDDSLQVAVVACVGQVQDLRKRLAERHLLSGTEIELLHTLSRVLDLLEQATQPISTALDALSPYVEPEERQTESVQQKAEGTRGATFERLWILRR